MDPRKYTKILAQIVGRKNVEGKLKLNSWIVALYPEVKSHKHLHLMIQSTEKMKYTMEHLDSNCTKRIDGN